MQTLKAFIESRKITASARLVDSNPNMQDSWDADHYQVTLHRKSGHRLTTFFSMGKALCREPNAEDVLNCLALDASGVENAQSFEDWAGDYGYDSDSRKAHKTFLTVQRQAAQLKRFLGDDDYETLLWEIEKD